MRRASRDNRLSRNDCLRSAALRPVRMPVVGESSLDVGLDFMAGGFMAVRTGLGALNIADPSRMERDFPCDAIRAQKNGCRLAPVFDPDLRNLEKLLGGVGRSGRRSVRETPADFVALGGRTQFALLALSRGLKCAAAAHFFEDTLGIQFRLEALESPVNRLAFLHDHSTHAMIIGWFGWFRSFFGAR